jgi:hypothetical protein
MQLFDNIIEKREKEEYNSIYIHPMVTQNENVFETKKLDQITLNKIKDKLKKIAKNKVVNWQQIEYNYKNLSKIEKIFQNGTSEINYFTRTNNDFVMETNNNLIIYENIQNINEDQFPSLSIYDKITKKNIEKYNFENIEVLFISQNNAVIMCIDISKAHKNDKIKLKILFENLI